MPLGRHFLLLAAAVASVSCSDGRNGTAAPPAGIGPDAVLIRAPMAGGIARAHRVGSDSVLWQSRRETPALDAVLGFDDFLGLVMARDLDGGVLAIDLRLGTVSPLGTETMRGGVAEGASVFGLDSAGRVMRLTPHGTWTLRMPGGAPLLMPMPDGALLVFSSSDVDTRVRRLIPPEPGLLDSTSLPRVRLAVRTQAGDRAWLATDEGLLAIRTQDLTEVLRIRIGDPIVAIAPTPSGDRVFIATDDRRLRIVDRFAEQERGEVALPVPANALRMDPDGHYLLARAGGMDSVFVVSVGTNRVVHTIGTSWRDDLPLVTPDGGVLTLRGEDAVLVDAETGRERLRYTGGAGDLWSLVRWNGFRPRASGLDRPVVFEDAAPDSASADSAVAALLASRYGDFGGADAVEPVDTPQEDAPAPQQDEAKPALWTVSFATLTSEERARAVADTIIVDGKRARVVAGSRDGEPVWRVVLGPYASRRDAERAGMASRHSYWVVEGTP